MPQLGLGIGIDYTNQLRSYAQLVKSAGGVLYLDARKANGISKGINSPFTSQFVDLSGKGNDATLTNFAGTTADGYEMKLLPNGKTMPMLNCDGVDSYGVLNNTSSLDITGTEEFVFTFGFLTPSTINTDGQILTKNFNDTATTQYHVRIYGIGGNAGIIEVCLNGAQQYICSAGTILPNTMYDVRIYRIGGRLSAKIQRVETYNQPNATSLTSRPNARLFARSIAVGHAYQYKCSFAWLTIHRASYGNLSKVDYAIDKIAKDYI